MLIAFIFLCIGVWHIHKLQTEEDNDVQSLIDTIIYTMENNPKLYENINIPEDALHSDLHPYWYSNESKALRQYLIIINNQQ